MLKAMTLASVIAIAPGIGGRASREVAACRAVAAGTTSITSALAAGR